MPILIVSEVRGQTPEGYDGMLALLEGSLRRAPGFLVHASHPVEGGWRVLEVWDSKENANHFFANHVAPNLPDGVRPKRSVHALHSFLV